MTFKSVRRISTGTKDIRFTPFFCQESSSLNSSRAKSPNRISIWESRQVGWLVILCCSAVLFLSGCGSTVTFNSPATISALACTSASMTGAGTNSCTVNLNGAAGIGGLSVSLSSSDAAVALPATVTVPANATSVAFSATISPVTTAQTATLTATAGNDSKTFALELQGKIPPVTADPSLSLSTSSMAFGSVTVNTAATPESVTLTSSGTSTLTISAGTLTGAGFSMSGVNFPLTLNQGQTATLKVGFDPSAASAVTGQLTLVSNSAANPTAVISLSGTGTAAPAAPSTLSALSCASGSMTGSGTDACTITLNAAAGSGGQSVSLNSSDAAVTLPATVTVPANATSAAFSATIASVTTTQATTLTATTGTDSKTFALELNAYNPAPAPTPALRVSTGTLAFGSVMVNTAATPQSVTLMSTGTAPVTISAGTVTGAGFSMSGTSFPLTLNQGQTATLTVHFDPFATGAANGALTLTSNSSTNPSAVISLSGTGTLVPATLSALSCSSGSTTGSGTDACTVTLNAAAGSGGLSVKLSSSNAAVTLPATVTVPANATSAAFSATIAPVTTAQAATLTAASDTVSKTFSLELNAYVPQLSLSANNLAFGSVTVHTPATPELVTLTSSGTAPLTISAGTLTGPGFSMSGASFPLTLNRGQTARLKVSFDPTSTGAATGALTLTSNSTTNPSAVISLSGTGTSTAAPGTLSTLSCTSVSMTGSGTDACTVNLNTAAGSSGLSVSLSSSNAAVALPATVTVPANATSVAFSATISPVTTAQTVTLTATSGTVSKTFALDLNPFTPHLKLSTGSLAFGSVTVNTAAAPQSVTLTSSGKAPLIISAGTLTGTGFSMSGASFPLTLTQGQTATLTVSFDPSAAGAVTGALTLTSNSTTNPSAVISLRGTGTVVPGTLSALSCTSGSMTGAGTDACTVTLNTAAGSGGLSVSLSSSDAAVTLPATVTVPANSTGVAFSVAVASVTTAQTATLTATAGTVSKTFPLALSANTSALSLSTSSLVFSNVTENTAATKSVILTSSGPAPLIISAGTLTGTGFSMSGVNFPLTLTQGQTATLTVSFDPSTTTQVTGAIILTSNSSTNPSAMISLSGTGAAAPGTLSALSCTSGSMTGAGTDACTVTLNTAAGSGGLSVSLSSSDAAVTLPATVTVPANSTGVAFSAAIASVTTAQTATLTATAGTVSKTFPLALSANTPTLSLSTSSLVFSNVTENTAATKSVTLTNSGAAPLIISAGTLTGAGFSMSGVSFPLTLNQGLTATLTVSFDPTAAGAVTGALTLTSNSSTNPSATISLSGTGAAAPGTLSSLFCASGSITALGTDACTVMLNAAAGNGGLSVSLSSSSASAVTLPATVTVPANATSVAFSATIVSITTAQSVTLTATAAGSQPQTYALQLDVATPTLNLSTSNLAFGSVTVNTDATPQQVTLTNSGAAPLIISAGTLTGAGFSMSTVSFPLTLNQNQTAMLTVSFDPTVPGAATGTLTLASNSSTKPSVISLTGTGVAVGYQVNLTWDAPTDSAAAVVGYNIFRAPSGGSMYQQINSTEDSSTSYSDTTVASGTTYDYYVESVDSSGVSSVPSTTTSVAVPAAP
jgi:Abnormal spindle-like microcephaly-assoc'd, ASPM-SPD-2-Hydin